LRVDEIMIDVENLSKKFGDVTAVDEVTFHVNEGGVSVS
jgi:ABC-type Na+ transport system ATPase subunit NatA